MNVLRVRSLPIKDVIQNLAEELDTTPSNDCEMYRVDIPPAHGEGFVQGVNFPNGLAWIQYDCKFNEATEIRFTVNNVHPLKLLYNLSEKFIHRFEDEDEQHEADQFQNLIVGSRHCNGHILKFGARKRIRLNSVEIHREKFLNDLSCTIESLDTSLKNAMTDIEANQSHFFEGPYTLKIANIFESIDSFEYGQFVRKMFLAAKTYEILGTQLLDYSDARKDVVMAKQDHILMNEIEKLVEEDFQKYNTVRAISTRLKVPEPRLQKFFQMHFNSTGNEYLKNKRMNLIVEMLEDTSLYIGDIAKLVGIDSASYLSKIFRQKFTISPNEFRRNVKNNPDN